MSDAKSRRQFLKGLAAAAAGTLVVACQPQTVIVKETVEVEVEKVVKETVEVEKVVKETVEVETEVEKEVTRVVTEKETVVVEKERLIRVNNPDTIDSDRLLIVPGRSSMPNGFYGMVSNNHWRFGCSAYYNINLPLWGLYDYGPATIDPQERFEPMLVDWWEFADDGTQIEIHLRKEARWSDGVPVTTKDVLFTIELLYHPDEGEWIGIGPGIFPNVVGGMEYNAGEADEISGITLIDDWAMTIEFDPPSLRQMAYPFCWGSIVPEHHLSQYSVADIWAGNYPDAWAPEVISGPYKVVKWDEEQIYLEMERDDDWWGNDIWGMPGIKRWAEQGGMGINQFLAGECDVLQFGPGDYEMLSTLRNIDIQDRSRMTYDMIFCAKPERKLPGKVVKAINLSVDRYAMRDALAYGYGAILGSPFKAPEPYTDYYGEPICPTCSGPMFEEIPYDVEGAKALLAEAADEGIWDPNRKLVLIGGDEFIMLQQFLLDIGVESEIITGAELIDEALNAGEYDIWSGYFLTPNGPTSWQQLAEGACDDLWHTRMNFCDEEIMQFISDKISTHQIGTPEFEEDWQELADWWEENGWIWATVHRPNFFATTKDLGGVTFTQGYNYYGTNGKYGMLSWFWKR